MKILSKSQDIFCSYCCYYHNYNHKKILFFFFLITIHFFLFWRKIADFSSFLKPRHATAETSSKQFSTMPLHIKSLIMTAVTIVSATTTSNWTVFINNEKTNKYSKKCSNLFENSQIIILGNTEEVDKAKRNNKQKQYKY